MIGWLIDSSMRLRRLVVAAMVAVLGLGFVQLHDAPVDVYPEFDGTRVQVQAEALGLSAQEVEQLITVPIEQDLLNGIPWLTSITSRSMPGLSAIDLDFEPGTDLYRARQMVQERMSQAKALPNVGTPPAVIQPTSSTSRVQMVGLTSSSVSLIEMSVLARWQIRPRLMSIPGVAQVSIFGQQDRQLQVQVDPRRLEAAHVTLTQLIETTGNALWVSPLSFVEASTPGTGGFIETPNQRLGVQHISPITTAEQLGDISVQGVTGPPVRLRDVTRVVEDHQPLIGAASDTGRPSLMLVVERFPGANAAQVTRDVDEALAAMRPGLRGITVDASVYRPVRYLASALHRLGLALLIGAALLGLVIGFATRSWRVAVLALLSTATAGCAAVWVLYLAGQTLTTMTLLGLAAVAILIIDDAVGDAVALRSRFRERRETGKSSVNALLTEVVSLRRGPLAVATAIIVLALGPLFLLTGPAGALVRASVLVLGLALLTALVVALVLTPVLAVVLLGGARPAGGPAAPPRGWAERGLDGLSARVGSPRRAAALLVVLLALLAVSGIAMLSPGRVLPTAQDRSVIVALQAAPGTALAETNRITTLAAAELDRLPGVRAAGTHVGRAIASDRRTDVNAGEIWLTIGADADYEGTLAAIRSAVRNYPGLRSEVATYTDERLAEAGATTGDAMVVRVYGQDLPTLQRTAEDVRQQLQTVPGIISPTVEPVTVEPAIDIQVDLAAAQRLGIVPGDVRRDVATLVSGLTVGSLYEQQAVFDVVVWGGSATRQSVTGLQALLIDTPGGGRVRLGDVATVRVAGEASAISHDAVSRSLDVMAQVRGRSAADVAADVTAQLRRMDFPYEYRAEVVGDAVARSDTYRWVLLTSLAVAVVTFLLLQSVLASWRGAAVLLLVVPLGGVGALLGARLTGGVLTGGVLAAGFAVVALTLRQGLTLIRRAQELHLAGMPTAEAMRTAVRTETPAVTGVALAGAALFLPAAVMGGGAGLELLQPFAVALMTGLISVVLVVLVVVPGIYPAVAGLRRAPAEPDPGPGTVAPDDPPPAGTAHSDPVTDRLSTERKEV